LSVPRACYGLQPGVVGGSAGTVPDTWFSRTRTTRHGPCMTRSRQTQDLAFGLSGSPSGFTGSVDTRSRRPGAARPRACRSGCFTGSAETLARSSRSKWERETPCETIGTSATRDERTMRLGPGVGVERGLSPDASASKDEWTMRPDEGGCTRKQSGPLAAHAALTHRQLTGAHHRLRDGRTRDETRAHPGAAGSA
jgi:hypothetical protein